MCYLFTLVSSKISLACLCLCSKIITKKQNWWNDSGARPQVQQTFHNNSKQEGTDAGGADDAHSDEAMVLTQLLSQKTTWWVNGTLHEMSTDRNKTNEAADLIHDSTVIANFSKLQFAVQWLPKLTYGRCWCRIGFLHLHAARKHGNARCKSYSNALLWTKKRKNCLELRNTSEASALLLEAAFSPSFFISMHLWQHYTAEEMKGEIQWIMFNTWSSRNELFIIKFLIIGTPVQTVNCKDAKNNHIPASSSLISQPAPSTTPSYRNFF